MLAMTCGRLVVFGQSDDITPGKYGTVSVWESQEFLLFMQSCEQVKLTLMDRSPLGIASSPLGKTILEPCQGNGAISVES